MTQKELKRLSRGDLLEMLLELSKENDQLRREVRNLRSQLEERIIAIEGCGSLAEAALNLNGVFQAAQAACEQYTENIRTRADRLERQTREQCEVMLAEARAQAEAIVADARKKQAEQDEKYLWITELMENSEEV